MATLTGIRCVFRGCRATQSRALGFLGNDKATNVYTQQIATIISPSNYRLDTEKPKPWPYEHKTFQLIHQFIDSTEDRFDENTKVIVVDGNLGVGKTKLAKELADHLEFHYIPPVTEKDVFYSNVYDMDIRWLNHSLPKEHQFYDLKSWLQDPHPENGFGSKIQVKFYIQKVVKYAWGLHHLYSTGQGVVFDGGSPFSDQVFPDAMHACGWMSRPALKYYQEFKRQTIYDMFKPHLTIYLDAPAKFVMDKVRERDHPAERGSKVLTEKFAKEIDYSFKKHVLPHLKQFGEVLVYDATNMENLEVIIEDIERLKLENDNDDEHKFIQWHENDAEDLLSYYRRWYGSKHEIYKLFNLPLPWHVPEMMDSPETCFARRTAIENMERTKFDAGFNPETDDMWRILISH